MKIFSTSEAKWGFLAAFSIWLGFPNDLFSLPPVVILWPVALSALGAGAGSAKSALLGGWLATLFGMTASLYWLAMPIAQVGGLAWPLAFLCALLVCACLAAQGGFFCALTHELREKNFWLLAVILSLVWYLLEYSFARALGFPWTPICGALIQWPLMVQTADIFGGYFTGALWFFGALLCLNPLKPHLPRPNRIFSVILGCLCLSCLLWYGIFQIFAQQLSSGDANIIDALIVEGNVDQNQKWTPPFQKKSLDIYLRLTDAGIAKARNAGMKEPLILWPETAMPFFYETSFHLSEELRDAVRAWGAPLLFGAPGIADSDEEVFNRAFLLGPDGKTIGRYDKVHLVPFGEYLPEWLKLDFLEALVQGVGIYREGNSIKSLNYENLALGVLICYEGIFPWLARDRITGGANILVDISNDGWFGGSPAARQHLFLTVLRCLEENRWLIRATNTGLSAVADNRGRIMLVGPTFQEGFLLCRARLLMEKSAYYYFSPWLPWLCLAALAAALAGSGKARL